MFKSTDHFFWKALSVQFTRPIFHHLQACVQQKMSSEDLFPLNSGHSSLLTIVTSHSVFLIVVSGFYISPFSLLPVSALLVWEVLAYSKHLLLLFCKMTLTKSPVLNMKKQLKEHTEQLRMIATDPANTFMHYLELLCCPQMLGVQQYNRSDSLLLTVLH